MWVVLPIKNFDVAKSRLAGALDTGERGRLAAAMAEDVLDTITSVAQISGILVVTEDARAAALATRHGAECIGENPAAPDMSGAVAHGAKHLTSRGIDAMLALPGDLPLLAAAELEQAIQRARRCRAPFVLLVADDTGEGTNLVACSLPPPIGFRYGPGSFRAHRQAIEDAGAQLIVLSLPTVAFDIDTPHDLGLLKRRLVAKPAGRTAAVVATLDSGDRFADTTD